MGSKESETPRTAGCFSASADPSCSCYTEVWRPGFLQWWELELLSAFGLGGFAKGPYASTLRGDLLGPCYKMVVHGAH